MIQETLIYGTTTLRKAEANDAKGIAKAWYSAFSGVTDRHGFPRDFESEDEVHELTDHILELPNGQTTVLVRDGEIIGGASLWTSETVAGIGPVFVSPEYQSGGYGGMLFNEVLRNAEAFNQESVRLTQAAFNLVSLSLYAKRGFQVKEPLVVMMNPPGARAMPSGYSVRPATPDNAAPMDELFRRSHGHSRRADIDGAIEHGTARVTLKDGEMVGYATDLGFLGHAVATRNEGLYALIASVEEFTMSGIFVPTRNAELFAWCLANGMQARSPWNLMVRGWYQTPAGPFLPSALY